MARPMKTNPRHLAWAAAFARGVTPHEIADAAGVSHQAVSKALLRLAATGATVTATGATDLSHDVQALSYGTSPDPLRSSGIKDRGDGRDAGGRFVEDRLT